MALSVSQSRSKSSWTNDLLDLQHRVSEDGSRIDDSRILRFVKQRRDSSCSSVDTHTVQLASKWSKIKDVVSSASKIAETNEEEGEEGENEEDQSTESPSSPSSHKKKGFSKILKRMLFGKSTKEKYRAEPIVIEAEPDYPSKEIFVKEYDPTSDSVARFNDWTRRAYATKKDKPSEKSLAQPTTAEGVASQQCSRI